MTAEEIIARLKLKPHPKEGGFYLETYRDGETIPASVLPARYSGPRAFGTCIYYLLTPSTFSAMHRLQSDEIFHFYLGDPVEMLQIAADGSAETVIMGQDIAAGMQPQHVVPGGYWQGARLLDGGTFALLGTTMSPGFDYADYRSGRRTELFNKFPQHSDKLRFLTRE